MANFHLAIRSVLAHEGGYVHDPDDPGGETNFGISKRSYPHLEIVRLDRDAAENIYLRDFWKPLLLDQVQDQEVATKLLDTAVLVGKSRAVRLLQRAVQEAGGGIVPVDGCPGPATLHAINQSSPLLLLAAYRKLLVTYYRDLVEDVPRSAKFLKGWLTRANA